jgi:hypothetical protein
VDHAIATRVIEMAPWPIQSPNVLTAHGVDLDHSIIRVAIPPGNRDKDTWSSSPCRELARRAEDRHTSSHDLDPRSWIDDHRSRPVVVGTSFWNRIGLRSITKPPSRSIV